jgi:hypothetical protein
MTTGTKVLSDVWVNSTVAGSSGPRAGSGGPRNATSHLNPSTTSNAGKPCKRGHPKRDSAG